MSCKTYAGIANRVIEGFAMKSVFPNKSLSGVILNLLKGKAEKFQSKWGAYCMLILFENANSVWSESGTGRIFYIRHWNCQCMNVIKRVAENIQNKFFVHYYKVRNFINTFCNWMPKLSLESWIKQQSHMLLTQCLAKSICPVMIQGNDNRGHLPRGLHVYYCIGMAITAYDL